MRWLLARAFVAIALATVPAAATPITYPTEWQPYVFKNGVSPTSGYAGCTDTWINQASPTFNYGSAQRLNLQGDAGTSSARTILQKFDISAIPSDEDIVLAIIRWYQTDGDVLANAPRIESRRLLFPFVAGTSGGAFQAGSASWDSAGGGYAWSGGGASGTLAGSANQGITGYYSGLAANSDTSVTAPSYVGPDSLTGWPRNAHIDDNVWVPELRWRPKAGATDIPRRTRGWIELVCTSYFQRIHLGFNFNHGLGHYADPDGYGSIGLTEYASADYPDKLYRPELRVWTVRRSTSSSTTTPDPLGTTVGPRLGVQ